MIAFFSLQIAIQTIGTLAEMTPKEFEDAVKDMINEYEQYFERKKNP